MNYKSYSDLSNDINKNINRLHELQIDLVVGIPRSGMIPAYMIALALNIHCIDLQSFLRNEPPKRGNTRKFKEKYASAWDAEKILLVDDSISSGKSMEEAYEKIPDRLKNKITKLAIYAENTKTNNLDIYLEKVPQPRVFEWNIYHHNILSISGIDIDGVLCVDPTPEENDDGEKYSPEGIEEAITEYSSYIDQMMLYNNQSPYTVALLVPNKEALSRYLKELNLNFITKEGQTAALKKIESEIAQFKEGGKFAGTFPQRWLPSAVAVLGEGFSEQNHFMNSTLKMVRGKITEYYKNRIDFLFTTEAKDICNHQNSTIISRFE